MSLPIQRVDDFVEAHEITYEGQVLAIACVVRACECTGKDVAKFADVAHMNAAHSGVDRKRPAQGAVFLLLRSQCARYVLVEERRDDKRMMRKPGFLHDPIDLCLAGKVGNVELAAADRIHVRQRRPDKVFDTGILGGAYRRCCLLELVSALLPEIGHKKNTVCPSKCILEGFRAV